MPLNLPRVPNPDVDVVDARRKATNDFYRFLMNLITALLNRVPVTGSVTFAAATTATVTFATPEANDDYDIWAASPSSKTYWATSKATTGFTLNASASSSETVRYLLIRA